MRFVNIAVCLTFVLTLGCATSRISNVTPIALKSKPFTETYKDPSVDIESYETFSVFPMSLIDSSARINNPILEKQMMFSLRNFFEMRGYTFVNIGENPDFLVAIDGSSTYKESYIPPQTYTLPRWIPGQTSTTYESGSGTFDFSTYGDYSSYGWGNWRGSSSSTTYTPGHLTFDSYTTGGYYHGSFYPALTVYAFDAAEFKEIWYGIGAGTSSTSDFRISSQIILSDLIDEFPVCRISDREKNRSSGAIGISALVLTNTGNDYFPFILDVKPYSPAYRAGLRKWDIILTIDGESTLNRSFVEAMEMLFGDEGTVVELEIRRLDETKHKRIVRANRNELFGK